MKYSKQQQGQLLSMARQFALERLIVADGLADEVAMLAVTRLQAEDGELADDELPGHLRHLVDNQIATHFRHQNSRPHPNGEKPLHDHEALVRFVTGVGRDGSVPIGDAIAEQIWRDLSALLEERQLRLVRLMVTGTPQSEIAAELGYRSADVVKVTVNRLRVRVRREFAVRLEMAQPDGD